MVIGQNIVWLLKCSCVNAKIWNLIYLFLKSRAAALAARFASSIHIERGLHSSWPPGSNTTGAQLPGNWVRRAWSIRWLTYMPASWASQKRCFELGFLHTELSHGNQLISVRFFLYVALSSKLEDIVEESKPDGARLLKRSLNFQSLSSRFKARVSRVKLAQLFNNAD